jgi:hypothetical protein
VSWIKNVICFIKSYELVKLEVIQGWWKFEFSSQFLISSLRFNANDKLIG